MRWLDGRAASAILGSVGRGFIVATSDLRGAVGTPRGRTVQPRLSGGSEISRWVVATGRASRLSRGAADRRGLDPTPHPHRAGAAPCGPDASSPASRPRCHEDIYQTNVCSPRPYPRRRNGLYQTNVCTPRPCPTASMAPRRLAGGRQCAHCLHGAASACGRPPMRRHMARASAVEVNGTSQRPQSAAPPLQFGRCPTPSRREIPCCDNSWPRKVCTRPTMSLVHDACSNLPHPIVSAASSGCGWSSTQRHSLPGGRGAGRRRRPAVPPRPNARTARRSGADAEPACDAQDQFTQASTLGARTCNAASRATALRTSLRLLTECSVAYMVWPTRRRCSGI